VIARWPGSGLHANVVRRESRGGRIGSILIGRLRRIDLRTLGTGGRRRTFISIRRAQRRCRLIRHRTCN
jgi:hypothetical protein